MVNIDKTAIMDAISSPIRVVDKDGCVLFANNAMVNDIGISQGEICYVGLGFNEECEGCVRKRIFAGEKNVKTKRRVGDSCFHIMASPLMDEKGDIIGVIESFSDISDVIYFKDKLIDAYTSLTRDLSMARRLQRTMQVIDVKQVMDYKFSSAYYPCEAIGGDAFDCVSLPDGRLLFYVADVSGHGVYAAMLTVFLRQELSALCKRFSSMSHILHYLQVAFTRFNAQESTYITIFMVTLDLLTGVIEYVNAGHSVLPLIKRSYGTESLFIKGAPICRWIDSPERHIGQTTLRKGSRLLLYTDGIIDRSDPDKSEQILRSNFECEPFEPAIFFEKSLGRSEGTFEDDIVLVVCEAI